MTKWLREQDEQNYKTLISVLGNNQNAVVAFIGAGISAQAGYPLWNKLVEKLAERANLIESELPPHDDLYNFRVADLCSERLGDQFDNALAEILDPSDYLRFTSIHQDLIQIPFKAYVTTNFDLALEKSARDIEPIGEIFIYPELHPTTVLDGKRNVYHLHGVLYRVDGTLFVRSTIMRLSAAKRAYEHDSVIQLFVNSIYQDSTLLFIGFRPQEYFFSRILAKAREEYIKATITRNEIFQINKPPRPHFCILPREYVRVNEKMKEIDLENEIREDKSLSELGVIAVRYANEDESHSGLRSIVEDMRAHVGKPPKFELREHIPV